MSFLSWVILLTGWLSGWFLSARSGECRKEDRCGAAGLESYCANNGGGDPSLDTPTAAWGLEGVSPHGEGPRVEPAAACLPAHTYGPPRVSVIVPARNEERRIGPLLASLRAQTLPPDEVIVVDDSSTDGTARLARESGAAVVSPGALPPGWLGKPWACHRGAQASGGSVLIFLDADTRLEPDGVERLLAEQALCGGLLAVQPYHEVKRPYEQLSAFFNLIVPASTAAFTPWGDRIAPQASFGPCIVCSRDDYTAAGGHEAVRGEVLENLALGRRFRRLGLPIVCRTGRGTLSFRMYPEGLRALAEGWSKSFAKGARTTSLPVLIGVVLWLSGCASAATVLLEAAASVLPFWIGTESYSHNPAGGGSTSALSRGVLLFTAAVYSAFAGQLWILLRRTGSFHSLTALLYPIPLAFFFILFSWSAVQTFGRRKVFWKGREITVSKNGGAE
ncbi:glycosyltransferase family 2 protein [Paenibacillus sp. FJAT-26967]|uniref:glycosyltransferase family 2 protein n=1 Tax=Paenibacillus sp. FJAT-26967 TaxID=1729690 RepID=UPI0008395FCE|nr:glycosyltransferase family 2 protein [Paenibacillus sp. FJAT-26967]